MAFGDTAESGKGYDTTYDWMLTATPEQKKAQYDIWRTKGITPAFMNINPALKSQYNALTNDYFAYSDTVDNPAFTVPTPAPVSSSGNSALQQLLNFYNQQQTSVGTRYDDLLKRLGNIEALANKRITRGYERGIEQFSRPATDYAQRFGTVNVPANMNAFANYLQAVGVDPTISQSVQAQQDAVLNQAQGQQQNYLNRMSALESSGRQGMVNALTNAMTQATKAAARQGRDYRFKLEQQRQDELAKLREQALLAQLKYGR